MSDIALRVDHLSKLYRIGARQQRHDTTATALSAGLRDALTSAFRRQALAATDNRTLTTDTCSLITDTFEEKKCPITSH
jgi:hypothetical protein